MEGMNVIESVRLQTADRDNKAALWVALLELKRTLGVRAVTLISDPNTAAEKQCGVRIKGRIDRLGGWGKYNFWGKSYEDALHAAIAAVEGKGDGNGNDGQRGAV